MDTLPQALVLEILSRLDDSADVARCRAAWKTFNTVSLSLRSINLQLPLSSYIESGSRVSNASSSSQITSPLKTIFLNVLSNLIVVESVRIGIKNLPRYFSHAGVEAKDLHLTDGDFIMQWLPWVSGSLKSLSISDFWPQSCRRRSNVLSLVSAYCNKLVELEVKNAWLSVDNMNQMLMVTSLTLESIRLDDKELIQLNKSFPNLQVLNLIDVRGLKLPTVHLLHLKTCHWTITDAPPFVTVLAPNLITLTIEGKKPAAVHVETPLLTHFHLALPHADPLSVEKFENLKTVWIEASFLYPLLVSFRYTDSVENLTLDSRGLTKGPFARFKFSLENLFNIFPNMTSLCFRSRAWSEFEVRARIFGIGMEGLKTFCGYLMIVDLSLTLSLVACVLDQCFGLVDVSLLIHNNVASYLSKGFMCTCMQRWPNVNWKWGTWEEGKEDSWISDEDLMQMSSYMNPEFRYVKKQRS
ncbi:F-box/LRR-repeat protein At4g29420 [Lactuca sativa]|uniref:F-box domain-containing protein n=1 Tax=Lactuca sativa TaxID=4236 RepID=A0A9R1V4H2_LACSA|nr:F-box/LRR-repeat protein At4g29420 [Lactuca sativa]KAJ0198086.1 hypothetical protein LSAT_V11C700358260 [Lactuca sativa]